MDERRAARYGRIEEQLRGMVVGASPGVVAAMATIAAVLHAKMPHHLCTGFCFVAGADELHVGPYQGPVACQVLRGRGVCLHAVRTRGAVVVPDLESFPGHIPCDPRAKSEIVVPVLCGGRVIAVLDIDSERPAAFDEEDVAPLEQVLSLLRPHLEREERRTALAG